jgi:hypothetical protein
MLMICFSNEKFDQGILHKLEDHKVFSRKKTLRIGSEPVPEFKVLYGVN